MATTKFKGQPVKIIGEFIKTGTVAPDFELVKTDLSSFSFRVWTLVFVQRLCASLISWQQVCLIPWYWRFPKTCLLLTLVSVRRKVLKM